jgi:hypothetical protein
VQRSGRLGSLEGWERMVFSFCLVLKFNPIAMDVVSGAWTWISYSILTYQSGLAESGVKPTRPFDVFGWNWYFESAYEVWTALKTLFLRIKIVDFNPKRRRFLGSLFSIFICTNTFSWDGNSTVGS